MFHCESISATLTANFSDGNIVALLYGGGQRKKFASRLDSRILSKAFGTRMVPAVICRAEKETARDALRSSALKFASSSMHETVMFRGLTVLMRGDGRFGDRLMRVEGLCCLRLGEFC